MSGFHHKMNRIIYGSRTIKGIKITAVRGKDEFIVGIFYFNPIIGFPKISKAYDLLFEIIEDTATNLNQL